MGGYTDSDNKVCAQCGAFLFNSFYSTGLSLYSLKALEKLLQNPWHDECGLFP